MSENQATPHPPPGPAPATTPSLDTPAPPPPSAATATTPIPAPMLTLPRSKTHLRYMHPSDVPALQRAADSPAVAKYLSYRFASPYTLEDAERWVAYVRAFKAPGTDILPNFAICDAATDTVLGGIGVKTKEDIEAGCFEVGYWLGEESWGRGIMTEACQVYVKWVFETFPGIHRLDAGVFEGNDGSVRVLERAGFVHEGTLRKAGVKHGVVFDISMYGLLREECSLLG